MLFSKSILIKIKIIILIFYYIVIKLNSVVDLRGIGNGFGLCSLDYLAKRFENC